MLFREDHLGFASKQPSESRAGGAESMEVTAMHLSNGCSCFHGVCACLKLSQIIVFLILTGSTIKSCYSPVIMTHHSSLGLQVT